MSKYICRQCGESTMYSFGNAWLLSKIGDIRFCSLNCLENYRSNRCSEENQVDKTVKISKVYCVDCGEPLEDSLRCSNCNCKFISNLEKDSKLPSCTRMVNPEGLKEADVVLILVNEYGWHYEDAVDFASRYV